MTSIDQNRTTRSVALLAATALISACASTPTETTSRSVPLGSDIRVTGIEPDVKTPNAKTAGEAVAGGVVVGAAKAALLGAGAGIMMGFGCGPLLEICIPVGAVVGLAGGAIFGAVAGGVTNAMRALPKDKAEALEAIMTAMIVDFSGSQKLVEEFKAQSNDRWTLTEAGASTEITLGIEGLFIEQGTKDSLAVKLVTSMVVSHGPGELDTAERILFTYVRQHHVDYWIEDDGANFKAMIHAAYAANIADMTKVLEGYSPPNAGGPSGSALAISSPLPTPIPPPIPPPPHQA